MFRAGAFVSALVTLVVAVLGGHLLIATLFERGSTAPHHLAGSLHPATTTSPARVTPMPSPTAAVPTVRVVVATPGHRARPRAATPTAPTPTGAAISSSAAGFVPPTAGFPPAPTPTPGTISLINYWLGSDSVQSGHAVTVVYVIDNGTGITARLTLGASIKTPDTAGWGRGAISDPAHDVVAVVAPGVSTHLRYFLVPARVHPGQFDVAWGLLDASSHQRVALVAARRLLRVTH